MTLLQAPRPDPCSRHDEEGYDEERGCFSASTVVSDALSVVTGDLGALESSLEQESDLGQTTKQQEILQNNKQFQQELSNCTEKLNKQVNMAIVMFSELQVVQVEGLLYSLDIGIGFHVYNRGMRLENKWRDIRERSISEDHDFVFLPKEDDAIQRS
ncbi:hypothetical protein Anapl_04568 [Anas platyrhynchos]|uniref:Uncharacterized protein n=1 Tax=Anas platyrhynchos TaxID=8839 RepID=R0JQG4_ANAPL|nr:hypothetical protein Anapl_04568 [Anas platyrhynchos]